MKYHENLSNRNEQRIDYQNDSFPLRFAQVVHKMCIISFIVHFIGNIYFSKISTLLLKVSIVLCLYFTKVIQDMYQFPYHFSAHIVIPVVARGY